MKTVDENLIGGRDELTCESSSTRRNQRSDSIAENANNDRDSQKIIIFLGTDSTRLTNRQLFTNPHKADMGSKHAMLLCPTSAAHNETHSRTASSASSKFQFGVEDSFRELKFESKRNSNPSSRAQSNKIIIGHQTSSNETPTRNAHCDRF